MVKFILDNFDTIFRDEKSFETFDKMILDLAVRGKLVPQIEDEEPASELLQRIKEEKERLVSEKVIKKEKPLPPITEGEKPFDIPSSWEWVRLGKIIKYTENLDIQKKLPKDTLINYVDIDAIDNKNYSIKEVKIKSVEQLSTRARRKLKKDYIMYSLVRPYLNNIAIVKENLENYIGSTGFVVFKTLETSNIYIVILLLTNYIKEYYLDSIKGFNSPSINIDIFENTLIPLPPLDEQFRIVKKVEKLQELSKKFKEIYNSNEKTRANLKKSILEEVEKSDTNNELLISLEKLFGNFEKVIKTKEDVKDIRNLVLSLAVRGKLVPQIESEEPASKLLEKIKEEKERLIAEKVIKKEKPLPPITEDEKPFDIPNSWKWVRLGNIGSWGSGATPSRTNSEYYLKGTIPWLKTGELNDGYINSSEEKITEKALKNTSVRLCSPGDVLIAMYGATIGKLGILNIEATTNQACCACTPYVGVSNKYLFLYLLSKRENFKSQGVGGAQPNISKEKIINTLFLLPPLQEQERIVKRVDELMVVCDALESKIEMGEKINQKLLASLLK